MRGRLGVLVLSIVVFGLFTAAAQANTYTVTTAGDTGAGSLRQALTDANAHVGLDTVNFNIAGPSVIVPATPLPPITDRVVVDGTTQPGFSAGNPAVQIQGFLVSSLANGLEVRSGGSTIRGIAANFWPNAGIALRFKGGNTVTGCSIGPGGGNGLGILISEGSASNTIGGSAAGKRNLISGNDGDGIRIEGVGSDHNRIDGNYIGTDSAGTGTLSNLNGVVITDGPRLNLVAYHNVISGNQVGVQILNARDNRVAGDFIGTDKDGLGTLGNVTGVEVRSAAAGNTIGGASTTLRNVISGNDGNGVLIAQSAARNRVQGNYIGTDKNGTSAIPNTGIAGIAITTSATANAIGGSGAARNLISGNNGDGVQIAGPDGNQVTGNWIGTDKSGAAALPNSNGVTIVGGSANTIGRGNVISGNTGFGVQVDSGTANVVAGNLVGTDKNGLSALGNGTVGVDVGNGTVSRTRVGGTVAADRNVISGNTQIGLAIEPNADRTTVQGNYIGVNRNGTAALPNLGAPGADAAVTVGGTNATIGGDTTPAANVISGNDATGVEVVGIGTQNNVLSGNMIGTNRAGTAAIPNTGDGVLLLNFAHDNTVGPGNVISGNGGNGVKMDGTTSQHVVGNLIGTGKNGTTALGNTLNGVLVQDSSTDTVGDTGAFSGNTIAFNGVDGVQVNGSGATGNAILRNSMFSNVNLGIELAAGGNNNHAAPVITSVTTSGGATTISGTAGSSDRVEVFSNPSCAGAQGRTFLGAVNTTGTWSIDVAPLTSGTGVTATATDTTDGTSQFSACSAAP